MTTGERTDADMPSFSLGLEFLSPVKEPKEKQNKKKQARPVSTRFASLSESEMENIVAERHSGRTKQITNWSVATFKGKNFHSNT